MILLRCLVAMKTSKIRNKRRVNVYCLAFIKMVRLTYARGWQKNKTGRLWKDELEETSDKVS